MVCIAAFIILALIGVFVAIISIFKPKIGKAYLRAMKKAWGCLWKKVRLQKCETGFKDDVKNTLLSRVIIKHPKWVKPLSVLIEVLSVAIVIVAIWALLTAIKSLLALWALGSCNVTQPEACSLNPEIGCSATSTSEPQNIFEATGRWFTEWGEIFEAIPDKFHTYDANDYDFNYISINSNVSADAPIAIDIFDPGCRECMISYRNQKAAGFFDNYNVRLVPFAIQNSDGTYRFKNSEIVVKYMLAAEQFRSGLAINLLDRIFTGKNSEGIAYQDRFNDDYTSEQAAEKLETWLKDAGVDESGIAEIRKIVSYPETTQKISDNKSIAENKLHIKSIPTMIYSGKKHVGRWKSE